jgi:recombinational DNA repair protein (RecF pathway)
MLVDCRLRLDCESEGWDDAFGLESRGFARFVRELGVATEDASCYHTARPIRRFAWQLVSTSSIVKDIRYALQGAECAFCFHHVVSNCGRLQREARTSMRPRHDVSCSRCDNAAAAAKATRFLKNHSWEDLQINKVLRQCAQIITWSVRA